MTGKHTPTPWRESKICSERLYSLKGIHIAIFERKDDLLFTKHCVNTHDTLVEQVEALKGAHENVLKKFFWAEGHGYVIDKEDVKTEFRAALAKCKPEGKE